MERSNGTLVESGVSIRTSIGRTYPGFVTAELSNGSFMLVPRLFGFRFHPILEIGIMGVKRLEVIKERGFTLLKLQADDARAFTMRSRIPGQWVKAFQDLNVPVSGMLEFNVVERSVGAVQTLTKNLLSGAAVVFALLTFALVILLLASKLTTHWRLTH